MQTTKGTVLVIDDDVDICRTAKIVLKPHFSEILTEGNPEKIPFLLNHHKVDVILLDMNFSPGVTTGREGIHWLKKIIEIEADSKVIMMTAYGQINLAVDAMKEGAVDFVVKPWENEKLRATVNSIFHLSKSVRELKELKHKQHHINQIKGDEIIGKSKALKEVFKTINKVAPTDANILIMGENGTGKEMVAHQIHIQSEKYEQIFMKVDLGAIPESLFESELFGHLKGAFTDAKEDRPGRLELADGGTLFLDEITNLSFHLQSKLLSVLQNREVTRVGSSQAIPIDIRLISATNVNPNKLIKENLFREDLLFRLNTVEIWVPPLRDRLEDLKILCDHFILKYASKYRKGQIDISKKAIKYLSGYDWPGNIRELMHAIERSVIMTDKSILEKSDFILYAHGSTLHSSSSLNLDDREKEVIAEALQKHNGNISQTAKELGLGRTTLYRKIQKYGL